MSSSEKGDGGCWCRMCPPPALPVFLGGRFRFPGLVELLPLGRLQPMGACGGLVLQTWACSALRPGYCCGLRGSLRALGAPPPGALPTPFLASAPSVGVGYRFPEWSPYLGDRAPSGDCVPLSLLGSVLQYTGDAAHPTGHGCARSMPVEAQSPHTTCGDSRGWDPLAWQCTVSH